MNAYVDAILQKYAAGKIPLVRAAWEIEHSPDHTGGCVSLSDVIRWTIERGYCRLDEGCALWPSAEEAKAQAREFCRVRC